MSIFMHKHNQLCFTLYSLNSLLQIKIQHLMDLVCHEYSWSSPSSLPLQILTAPEKATPAVSKQKKRKVLTKNESTRHPVRRKKGVCQVRETAAVASSHQRAASEAAREFCPVSSLAGIRFGHDEEVVNSSSSSKYSFSEKNEYCCWLCNKVLDKYCWRCNRISGTWSDEFVDEEAMFNMPALLDGMAEGMLLTPLGMKKGFSWTQYEVDDEAIEFSLWVN